VHMAAVSDLPANLAGMGEPVALSGMQVSPEFFSIIGVPPWMGRDFLPEEGIPGRDTSVILSYGLWQSRYGGDGSILGKKITINGSTSTVVCIMLRGFAFPNVKSYIRVLQPIVRSTECLRDCYD